MTYDPIAQSEALLEELKELRAEANEFRWTDGGEEQKKFEEAFEFALAQAVTAKVIGEHPEIRLTPDEQQRLAASGYELATSLREMRESLEFLRRTLPDAFQRGEDS